MDIIRSFDELTFLPSGYFAYDAASEVINYNPDDLQEHLGRLSLVHEISHALLNHFNYSYDIELLLMEIDAWAKTRELCNKLGLAVDEDYISDCIESYDSWLTARSTCPKCNNFCMQKAPNRFRCFLCGCEWKVNDRKDCRVIRKIIN